MNKYFICFLFAILFRSVWPQSINQLTIVPVNPSATDTIYVISTITYSGSCSYGLVYSNMHVSGDTLLIMPTYCGYGMPTNCITTDTFKIAPLVAGTYTIKVQYHQGSVCPISSFDAVIGETSSAVSVSSVVATQIKTLSPSETNIKIYPNPAQENLIIEMPQEKSSDNTGMIIMRNSLGEVLMRKKVETKSVVLNLSDFPCGVYVLEIEDAEGFFSKRRVVLQ